MKISDECENGNFSVSEEAFCEHCGELAPFTATRSNGGTWYCLTCAEYEDDYELTEELEQKLFEIQKEKCVEYYKECLENAKNQTELF